MKSLSNEDIMTKIEDRLMHKVTRQCSGNTYLEGPPGW